MHIFLHADSNTDGGHRMAEHLQTVVQAGMARFAERLTRVEAHLSDVNSLAKSSDGDIHCTLEARLVGHDAIVVKDHAGNAHQAIEGAVHKLQRAVATALARHDPRGRQSRSEAPAGNDDPDRPG